MKFTSSSQATGVLLTLFGAVLWAVWEHHLSLYNMNGLCP